MIATRHDPCSAGRSANARLRTIQQSPTPVLTAVVSLVAMLASTHSSADLVLLDPAYAAVVITTDLPIGTTNVTGGSYLRLYSRFKDQPKRESLRQLIFSLKWWRGTATARCGMVRRKV